MDRLLADVKAKGDVARGELVYRRAEMNCLKCHGVDEGAVLGAASVVVDVTADLALLRATRITLQPLSHRSYTKEANGLPQ